jgi:hypothetical protein
MRVAVEEGKVGMSEGEKVRDQSQSQAQAQAQAQ